MKLQKCIICDQKIEKTDENITERSYLLLELEREWLILNTLKGREGYEEVKKNFLAIAEKLALAGMNHK